MPVRVLLVTGSLGPGGTELSVVGLARGLNARGRALPHVAVLGSAGSYGPTLRSEGIVVHELGIKGALRTPGRFRALLQLADIVRREKIGIVHTFLFDADVYGMLAARIGGPWSVITTRRAIKKGRPLHLLGYRLTNGFADRIVCNSEAVREFTLKKENPPSDKLRVIPNGVDLDRYACGAREPFRTRLGIAPNTLLVGSVGTL
ncbi:MAG: glycosyltransferase [Acidobacteriota bacterium]